MVISNCLPSLAAPAHPPIATQVKGRTLRGDTAVKTKAILKVVTRVKYVHRNKGNFESGHKSKVCS